MNNKVEAYLNSDEGKASLLSLKQRRSVHLKFKRTNEDAFKRFEKLGIKVMHYSKAHIFYKGTYKGDEIIINFYPLAGTYGIHTSYIIERDLHDAIHNQLMVLDKALKKEEIKDGR